MKFLYPIFLLALITVAIPVIIHLFQFRKYKTVFFSNLKFLQELTVETRKQNKLKHLLILACRVLCIASLVFAFAQPYFTKDKDTLISEGDNFISIYIDNSFSMEANSEDGSLLDEAKQQAISIVNAYKVSDKFQLITNDFKGSEQHFLTKEDFVEKVKLVEISPLSRNLSEVLNRAKDIQNLRNSDNKMVYLLSDFQKSIADFSSMKNDSILTIIVVPVQSASSANICLDSLILEAPVVLQGRQITINAMVSNYSEVALEKIPLKLTINNQVKNVTNIDLPANETQIVPLTFTLNEEGIVNGTVEVVDYPVVYDNKLFFTLNVNKEIPVLSIFENKDNYYVSKLFANDHLYRYDNSSVKSIDYSSISGYSMIIWNAGGDVSSGLRQGLASFVNNGGDLLIIPPVLSDGKGINDLLSQFTTTKYGALDNTPIDVSAVNFKHPLFKNVFEKIPDNTQFPKVFKHYAINSGSRSVGENIITLADNAPFLRVENVGKGLVYMLAVPLDEAFSDFTKQPLFVISLINMAMHSGNTVDLYAYVGNSNVPLKITNARGEVTVLKSLSGNFEMIPSFTYNTGEMLMNTHGELQEAGNYVLASGKDIIGGIAFNYNRNESKPAVFSVKDIKSQFSVNNLDNFKLIDIQKNLIQKSIAGMHHESDLWIIFCIFALVFLLTEVLLIRFI